MTPDHNSTAAAALANLVTPLAPISLDDLLGAAELQTRVDRKYLVTIPTLTTLIDQVGAGMESLAIDSRRVFGYSSVYFDTADLLCFRDHRQGRRRRFKVRTRTYTNSGECMLEVKAVGARGETVKHRVDYDPAMADRLTGGARQFANETLTGHPAVPQLEQTVTTDYSRATLFDPAGDSRLTIDTGLEFSSPYATVAAPEGTVIIETKSPGKPGRTDVALRRLGARPTSVSKYCIGVALLHPAISANKWNRVLHQNFGVGHAPVVAAA